MDPQSLPFREALIATEMSDRKYLLDGGIEAAAEMFRQLNLAPPPDLDRRMKAREKGKAKD